MKIAIDCRVLGLSGIGVYLDGVLPYLLKSDNEFFLFGNDNSKYKISKYKISNCKIEDCNVKIFSLKELFFFPSNIIKKINECDLYYSPFFNIPGGIKIPIYTTIHDVIFLDMPAITSRFGLIARRWFYRRSYKHSTKIFTVSIFSKERIEHHLAGASKTKVVVTYSAIQDCFIKHKVDNFVVNMQKGASGFILFVGNIKKHKGLQTLVESFRNLCAQGLQQNLVIAGSKENFRTRDKSFDILCGASNESRIIFTGAIKNEQLLELYQKADVLVQPSLYEGFCLPPLEALFCGTQALISDIDVLKEIYADFPVTFFKAASVEDLSEKLKVLLKDGKKNITLTNEQKQKYTFEKSANIILRHLLENL
ncbi:MAG: glycosyltransferase family 1 protein [Termitinemataceae bacterium]|nr:MAG: glycosyltransferase family 1 protein [Termitinemataceae bacterium]